MEYKANRPLPQPTESTAVPHIPAVMKGRREVRIVPIDSLAPGESPRLAGVDEEHARRLAEMETTLPPILVSRATMRVIDGMHRVRAAVLTGKQEIQIELFDGSEDEEFIQAVKANVAHGLPLSFADRRAAAIRILATHPELSDRAIGAYAGLAHKTVSTLRSRSTGEDFHLNIRLGADGRMRPISSQEGRRRAAEVIAERPGASLREVAATSGVSVGTAHDVRQRMRRGESPFPTPASTAALSYRRRESGPLPSTESTLPTTGLDEGSAPTRRRKVESDDPQAILQSLLKDPSLKRTDAGRALLQWLHTHVISKDDWDPLVATVPAHRLQSLATLARLCGNVWHQFAHELESRDRHTEAAQYVPPVGRPEAAEGSLTEEELQRSGRWREAMRQPGQ